MAGRNGELLFPKAHAQSRRGCGRAWAGAPASAVARTARGCTRRCLRFAKLRRPPRRAARPAAWP